MSSAIWPPVRKGDYVLRFRTELKGGDVAYTLWRDDVERFRYEQKLIFFIHGYADPVLGANEVYDTFEARMESCFSRRRAWADGAPVVRVYWPGDVDWLGPLSYLGYPTTVYAAERCAQQFALALAYMAGSNPAMTVKVMVHSLGNHLLLRALSLIREQNLPKPKLERVLMMAAAVPTWRLGRVGDDLRTGLEEASGGNPAQSSTGAAVTSIYSSADIVLTVAFPLGETIDCKLDGVLPVALGHELWYEKLPAMGLYQEAALPAPGVESVGHTDYWSGLRTEQVGDALGIIESSDRLTIHRGTLCKETPTRDEVDGRGTPQRDMSSQP